MVVVRPKQCSTHEAGRNGLQPGDGKGLVLCASRKGCVYLGGIEWFNSLGSHLVKVLVNLIVSLFFLADVDCNMGIAVLLLFGTILMRFY